MAGLSTAIGHCTISIAGCITVTHYSVMTTGKCFLADTDMYKEKMKKGK
jgi:hypothetical protein